MQISAVVPVGPVMVDLVTAALVDQADLEALVMAVPATDVAVYVNASVPTTPVGLLVTKLTPMFRATVGVAAFICASIPI
jgi:hypothetical protein